jgi:hypothetical protein
VYGLRLIEWPVRFEPHATRPTRYELSCHIRRLKANHEYAKANEPVNLLAAAANVCKQQFVHTMKL